MTWTDLNATDSISATFDLLNKRHLRTTSFGVMASDTATLAVQGKALVRGVADGEECYAFFRFPDELSTDDDITVTVTLASTASESAKNTSWDLAVIAYDSAATDLDATLTGTEQVVDATYPETTADETFEITFTLDAATYLTQEGLILRLGRVTATADPSAADVALVDFSLSWGVQRESTDP